jgi:hypothetical protein
LASSINTAAGKHMAPGAKLAVVARRVMKRRRPAMVASRRTAAPWRARGGWRAGRVEGVGFGGA